MPTISLADQSQQFARRYQPHGGLLEPRLVPGHEIVHFRPLRARCLNRVLEVRPVQPRLPPEERIDLLSEAWDTIAVSPEDVPIPERHVRD